MDSNLPTDECCVVSVKKIESKKERRRRFNRERKKRWVLKIKANANLPTSLQDPGLTEKYKKYKASNISHSEAQVLLERAKRENDPKYKQAQRKKWAIQKKRSRGSERLSEAGEIKRSERLSEAGEIKRLKEENAMLRAKIKQLQSSVANSVPSSLSSKPFCCLNDDTSADHSNSRSSSIQSNSDVPDSLSDCFPPCPPFSSPHSSSPIVAETTPGSITGSTAANSVPTSSISFTLASTNNSLILAPDYLVIQDSLQLDAPTIKQEFCDEPASPNVKAEANDGFS